MQSVTWIESDGLIVIVVVTIIVIVTIIFMAMFKVTIEVRCEA